MIGQRKNLRRLPQVDRLLREPGLRAAAARLGAPAVRGLVREALGRLRAAVRDRRMAGGDLERRLAGLAVEVAHEAERRSLPSLRPVLNATGVLIHTNLGRAPLSAAALQRVRSVAASYSTLEYDLEGRRRGSRASHLERLLAVLFPGRACHVVNNNAAALTLAVQALAGGREVVVSRGELVEIGGSFRIPEILAAGGARLREVGTTNRTRLADYQKALGRDTGLILKVHPSNYRVVGFTADVPVGELAALARRRRVPLVVDQGSGLLVPLGRLGVKDEPTVGEFLRQGADLVLFSGDKLLGGPQAGLIVGRPALVRRLRLAPLSRALRVGKMTIAALEATLEPYLRAAACDEIPVLNLLCRPAAELKRRAEALARGILESAEAGLEPTVARGTGRVGGGASPTGSLPSWRVGLGVRPGVAGNRSASQAAAGLERALRLGDPPVIALLARDHVWIDLRSVPQEADAPLLEAIRRAGRAQVERPPEHPGRTS